MESLMTFEHADRRVNSDISVLLIKAENLGDQF